MEHQIINLVTSLTHIHSVFIPAQDVNHGITCSEDWDIAA